MMGMILKLVATVLAPFMFAGSGDHRPVAPDPAPVSTVVSVPSVESPPPSTTWVPPALTADQLATASCVTVAGYEFTTSVAIARQWIGRSDVPRCWWPGMWEGSP